MTVADGEYLFRPRLTASAEGQPTTRSTLRGSRRAVLRSSSAVGDYGLHITGDHWRVQGLTVAHATKDIVLDQSVGLGLRPPSGARQRFGLHPARDNTVTCDNSAPGAVRGMANLHCT